MLISRAPRPALRPFVRVIWAIDEIGTPRSVDFDRERVLPTGTMHLAFRLSDHPLRLYKDTSDAVGVTIGHAVVGGARATFYVRDVSQPVRSVGAQLQPGAAELLLGAPAGELADQHTPLEDLWGRSAAEVRERLIEAGSPERQLDALESLLAARLPRVRALHPAVAFALERFAAMPAIGAVVRATGYSHRRFIALFRGAVGLTPKIYCRVLRFQGALAELAAHRARSSVDLALAAGYSDQPHFNREFRELAGTSPGRYRLLSPARPNHVPIP